MNTIKGVRKKERNENKKAFCHPCNERGSFLKML